MPLTSSLNHHSLPDPVKGLYRDLITQTVTLAGFVQISKAKPKKQHGGVVVISCAGEANVIAMYGSWITIIKPVPADRTDFAVFSPKRCPCGPFLACAHLR